MSEPIIAGSLKWIGEKALDLLADRLGKRILKEIDPELGSIQQELKDIRSTQEEMLAAPLAEGLRLLHFQDFEKARDKLIEAESKNPFAPIPKLWLAVTLAHLQKDREKGSGLLSEVVGLSPNCIAEGSHEISEELRRTMPRSLSIGPPSKGWSLLLDDEVFISQLASRFGWPKRLLQKYFGPYATRSTAAIARASVCGELVAVHWLLADDLRHKAEEVLGLFTLNSPEPIWVHLNCNEDLVFLSYRHVVVHLRDRDLFSLLDLSNGASVKRMSNNYFQMMFGLCDTESESWTQWNWKGTPPAAAYEKSAHFDEPRVEASDPTFGHNPLRYSEGATLRDPYGIHGQTIKISNGWNHFHYLGGANIFPSCRLVGDGKVECGNAN